MNQKPTAEQRPIVIRKVIHVDGTVTELTGPISIREAQRLINADALDTVLLRDHIHVMLIDDTGMIDGRPVNAEATCLYQERAPYSPHSIHGDVVVLPDNDFGGDL